MKNREIEFRGLRTNGDGWVYGHYFYDRQVMQSYIIDDESNVDVFSDSVGQFTGLKDKNGVKIYEGDKIKIWSFYHKQGNTSDWFGAEPQNSKPCYEEFLETMYATIEFKNGSFVAKNSNYEMPLIEVIKGLGSEISHFYLCGYGGSELEFIECLNDESYGEDYYNELLQLEGEGFYNRLEEIVNEITQEIEIIGNIHENKEL